VVSHWWFPFTFLQLLVEIEQFFDVLIYHFKVFIRDVLI
jgi:hypothetical protein